MNYLSKMQPIDPHSLFAIFEQGDEQVYKEHGMEDALKNPFVLMGMVMKGVENYYMMDIMYVRQYPAQYKHVREAVKQKYFTKMYNYLTRIDSTKFETFYRIGESFEKDDVFLALDTLKYFFEEIEHYEKCAVIKKFQDLLQETREEAPLRLI
jgi:hypothetical protein